MSDRRRSPAPCGPCSTLLFVLDKSIKQAFTTQTPVVFILSPLLTGGNPLAAAKLK